MNRVIISGTVDTIEQHTTSSGKLYCNFWINNKVKNKVEQHKCQVWGDMAEWLIENVEKGGTILIDGRLRNDWEDNTIIMVTSIDKWGELNEEERKESEEEYEEEPTEASKQDAQINIPDTTGFPEGSFKLKDIDTDELPFY